MDMLWILGPGIVLLRGGKLNFDRRFGLGDEVVMDRSMPYHFNKWIFSIQRRRSKRVKENIFLRTFRLVA